MWSQADISLQRLTQQWLARIVIELAPVGNGDPADEPIGVERRRAVQRQNITGRRVEGDDGAGERITEDARHIPL